VERQPRILVADDTPQAIRVMEAILDHVAARPRSSMLPTVASPQVTPGQHTRQYTSFPRSVRPESVSNLAASEMRYLTATS
jgi:hypothetical protein